MCFVLGYLYGSLLPRNDDLMSPRTVFHRSPDLGKPQSSRSARVRTSAPRIQALSRPPLELIRLVSMLAIEANDEWLVGRGYMSRQSMEPLLEQRPQREEPPELQAA